MTTVFYDGKCGLCSKEINHYKAIAPEGVFNWEDITQSTTALKEEGISLSNGLRFLHARDKNGQMHIGLDAFILIWGQLKRWKIVSKLASLPIVYQVLTLAYKGFANWRFKRLSHCQIAAKSEVQS